MTRDLNFQFSKMLWKCLVEIFRMPPRLMRISLRPSVFEIARGGGGSDPTPSPRRWLVQKRSRRLRVNIWYCSIHCTNVVILLRPFPADISICVPRSISMNTWEAVALCARSVCGDVQVWWARATSTRFDVMPWHFHFCRMHKKVAVVSLAGLGGSQCSFAGVAPMMLFCCSFAGRFRRPVPTPAPAVARWVGGLCQIWCGRVLWALSRQQVAARAVVIKISADAEPFYALVYCHILEVNKHLCRCLAGSRGVCVRVFKSTHTV